MGTFTMDGKGLKMTQREDGHAEECQITNDHTIYDVYDGTTGVYQSNCNVIEWNSGGVWTRIGSESFDHQSVATPVQLAFSGGGCSMPGLYIDEYQRHWTFTMDGKGLKMTQREDGHAE